MSSVNCALLGRAASFRGYDFLIVLVEHFLIVLAWEIFGLIHDFVLILLEVILLKLLVFFYLLLSWKRRRPFFNEIFSEPSVLLLQLVYVNEISHFSIFNLWNWEKVNLFASDLSQKGTYCGVHQFDKIVAVDEKQLTHSHWKNVAHFQDHFLYYRQW